jgi:hypothetical protein
MKKSVILYLLYLKVPCFWIATPPLGAREDDRGKHPQPVFASILQSREDREVSNEFKFLDCFGSCGTSQRRSPPTRLCEELCSEAIQVHSSLLGILILSFFTFSPISSASGDSPLFNTQQIENLTGAKGELDRELNVFKVIVPHTDLKGSAAGVKLTPALGLTSWAAFSATGEVRGEIVLFEDQINFVMKEALDHGLSVTALHNHYLWDNPRIMIMPIEGKGPLKDLATAVGKTFEILKKSSKGTIWARPPVIINPDKSTLKAKDIEDLFDKRGILKDGVFKLTWERKTKMQDHGGEVSMGIEAWAAFAGTDKQAVMLGEIAMKEEDVQNVLKTLLKHNIFIISLRQHRVGKDPRIMFVHYMGRGLAFELAKALKEALEQRHPGI